MGLLGVVLVVAVAPVVVPPDLAVRQRTYQCVPTIKVVPHPSQVCNFQHGKVDCYLSFPLKWPLLFKIAKVCQQIEKMTNAKAVILDFLGYGVVCTK